MRSRQAAALRCNEESSEAFLCTLRGRLLDSAAGDGLGHAGGNLHGKRRLRQDAQNLREIRGKPAERTGVFRPDLLLEGGQHVKAPEKPSLVTGTEIRSEFGGGVYDLTLLTTVSVSQLSAGRCPFASRFSQVRN